MTAAGYDPLYLATLLVIGLGALTFSVLTLHYWRQPSARRDPVFAAFTLACAASFLINIAARMAPDPWEKPLAAALDLATGAIPALRGPRNETVIRTLIADDEAPARARLRQLLAPHADIEIAGEAETGVQAMELAESMKPDLILLDIQMPGCTGLDIAASLAEPRPPIVFCTAYEEHAVDAFELAAVDYLLKPVSRARLAQALDRVRARQVSPATDAALDQASRRQPARSARFLVKHGESYLVVPESRVLFFASEGGLTRLVTESASYAMNPALDEVERRLAPSRFFRVSRAALVNLNAVAEVHPLPGGSGEVRLKTGQRLEVTRRRFRDLLANLEQGA